MFAEWDALVNAARIVATFNINEDSYIFSDSQTVVKQANGEWKVKHEELKHLHKSFLELKSKLPRLQIHWVPRQLIYLADKAAQKGDTK